MQVNPYLSFDGNCEAALKFYEKVLGAKIEATLHTGGAAGNADPAGLQEQADARADHRSTAKC